MRTLEFNTRIKNNQIQIPVDVRSEFKTNNDKDIKVIVLLHESDDNDDFLIRKAEIGHFFKGYSDSDSIYDNL
jgi:hypothetical protein